MKIETTIQFSDKPNSFKLRKLVTIQVGNLCLNGDISNNNNIFPCNYV